MDNNLLSMNRQQFNSGNNIGQVLTFQKSGATTSFDPFVQFASGSRRVSWRLNNGSGTTQIAGNGITYTGFTSDNGIRTIEMRGNSFRDITNFTLDSDNLFGSLNIPFELGGTFVTSSNPNLTGVTHVPSSRVITTYQINNCNITGNHDLSMFPNLGGTFNAGANNNLTGITHTPSSQNFSTYRVAICNLTGNLNLPLSGLGGSFWVHNNPKLTGITHVPSSQNFSQYWAFDCNLTGNLNLPLSGLGGGFEVYNNSGLTSITHVTSSQNFSQYYAYQCNLTGNLNLPFSGLGGEFWVNGNTGLTSITHVTSSRNFSSYYAYGCNLTGTLDLSPLTKLGGSSSGISLGVVSTYSNPNLTNIILPNTTQFFRNSSNSENNGAFVLYSCNFDYIDFKPLSGATFLTGATGNPRISLRDNGMVAADVNRIFVDFSGNATSNPTGWSKINLNIGGTNANPDSSSGGYNGLAAISFLTGSPYNWTITY